MKQSALILAMLMAVCAVQAQTIETLVSFTNSNGNGVNPLAALTLGNDGNFYGTTESGGIWNLGTVFQVTTNGTLTTLVAFDGTNGAAPWAALTLGRDGNFYGTTSGGISGGGTVFRLSLAPSILVQPSSQTNNIGATVTFLFSATSFTSMSFQWQKNGTNLINGGNISGANTNVLIITGISGSDASSYSVIVSDFYGTATSSNATLTVASITQQPQNEAQLLGQTAAFNVVVSGPSPSAYQWYFSNPALQTTAKAKAQISGGFVYSVVVTNTGSGYTTLPQVQFIGGGGSGAGGNATVSSGEVTNITMTNAGSGYTTPPAVLIDPPNGLLVGQTNAILNMNAITTNNLGSYFVVISNIYGSLTSSAATLSRAYPPGITSQPQTQFVGSGSGAFFSVTTTGTPPFNFQWWMVSSQLTNATATPLVTNGFVLGATINKAGAGYLAIPAVQFVGGSGSGAGGTATVSNRMVTAINITNAGSGYTTHPTIQIAAPTAIALTEQTASVLSLAPVAGTNAGNYYVVVTNYFGSVTSQVAILTVELPGYNQITSQLLTNHNMRLSFVGLTGTNYALDRTFKLSQPKWVPQATNRANAEGVLVFTNTPDTATNNFWRIREVP